MKFLVVTTLYPNACQQRHGIFVHARLRHLLAAGDFQAAVIAPVPWFPFRMRAFPQYSRYTDIPRHEQIDGIDVYHPRYLVIPRIGMLIAPLTLGFCIWRCARNLSRRGLRYDLIDAHYYYPDGVAVALAAPRLGKPFLVTARGTDLNIIAGLRLPRRMILWAANRAAASVTVCRSLRDRLVGLGADQGKVHVMRNGVDLEMFRPQSRAECRSKFGCTGFTLLSVGHLNENKGHRFIIEALVDIPDAILLIAGDGEDEAALKQLARTLGVGGRVTFLGTLPQSSLVVAYNAADALVLASEREGWANVLLEAMACGTPVVATDICGTPEVVQQPEAGVLVRERSGAGIGDGVRRLRENYPDRVATRRYAEKFSWDDTTSGLKQLMASIIATDPHVQRVSREGGRA